ncbi:hypothetical protein RMATCC62417_10764 [Rhizopus microsporus]|nr:hypothetical protein RMATCC62417_10764 [Rhizopus microsporus]
MDDGEIKHCIRQDTILPAQTFKQAISQQPINMEQFPQEPIYMDTLNTLRPVFDAYNGGYNFGERGLYYDVKRNPVNHFNIFYQISRLFEHRRLPVFNCFLSGAHGLLVTLPSTARFSAKTFWEFDGLMLLINWTTGAELSTLI